METTNYQNVNGATSALVHVARRTQTTIPAFTFSGAGPGATITFNAPGLIDIDGPVDFVGQRFLLNKMPGNPGSMLIHAGVYEVVVMGDETTSGVLQRTSDFDETIPTKIYGGRLVCVDEGTDAGKIYVTTMLIGQSIDVNLRFSFETPEQIYAARNLAAQLVGGLAIYGIDVAQLILLRNGNIEAANIFARGSLGTDGNATINGDTVTTNIIAHGAEIDGYIKFFDKERHGSHPPIVGPDGGDVQDVQCRSTVEQILSLLRWYVLDEE